MPSLGRFSIHLTAVDGSDNGKISLVKEGQGGFVVTESNEFNFNFYPCVVAWEGAENLYNNRLADNINPLLQTPEYHNVLEAMNMILTSRTKIITQEASDNEYTISDNDGRRYLYKADASHYCFTSIQSGGSCSLKRDDDSNPESLEEGCLDSMPFFVGTCDGSSVAVNRFRSTCNRVCNSVEHQECIIGIDDGDNDNNLRACYQSFRFEGHDDYCVCGDTSEKIFPPAVPPPGLVESTCDFECGSAECIMGIDDYNKPRRCDKTFTFGDNPDIEVDYCFCGGDSRNHFPTLSGADEDHRCMDADMCGSRSNCIVGMDDEDAGDGDKRRCNEPFTFEHDDIPLDDYCICSNPPEKVIPIPT
tara:strand:- start:119 stop:1201 length:1083 start_codon:yes stop_codon:yes gene_type:complete